MPSPRAIFTAILLAAALPANAGTLYKSVAPDGSVMFSDMPPPSGLKVIEQRVIAANGALKDAGSAASRTLEALADLFDGDAALAKANAQVDMAEHALAVARRELWSIRDGLRLKTSQKSPEDSQRVDAYKRDVVSARQALLDLLREKRLADLRREPGMPYIASR